MQTLNKGLRSNTIQLELLISSATLTYYFIQDTKEIKMHLNCRNDSSLLQMKCTAVNALTAVGALRALIDFTLSNARRFYSSMEITLAVKGLNVSLFTCAC